MLLKGKTALITGAGRGIGRAIALAYAEEGCQIAAVARTASEVEETAETVRTLGCKAIALVADVTNPSGVQRTIDETLAAFGAIDLLVNNAGYADFKPFTEYTLEEWQQSLAVNLTAPFLYMQAVAPHMIERKSGRMINISSVAGLRPIKHQSAYCAAKHGLNGLCKVLAMELREYGIGVHWVCPGGVDTKLSQEAMPDRDKSSWMTPDDIAYVCLFLAGLSPRATVDEVMIRRFGSVPLGG